METIYTGKEPLLAETLIERTIEERKIDIFKIKTISIDCFVPKDETGLWTISITINADYSYKSYYYSKEVIRHNYAITYLQHLKNMGVKKINLKKLEVEDNE